MITFYDSFFSYSLVSRLGSMMIPPIANGLWAAPIDDDHHKHEELQRRSSNEENIRKHDSSNSGCYLVQTTIELSFFISFILSLLLFVAKTCFQRHHDATNSAGQLNLSYVGKVRSCGDSNWFNRPANLPPAKGCSILWNRRNLDCVCVRERERERAAEVNDRENQNK